MKIFSPLRINHLWGILLLFVFYRNQRMPMDAKGGEGDQFANTYK